jgi:hypothetical protein
LPKAVTVLEDDASLIMPDDDPEEDCLVALGMGSLGRILVVIYTTREDRSGPFPPAKPRGGSRRNTSEDADEKGIRF